MRESHSPYIEIHDSLGTLIAMIARRDYEKPGVNFLSDPRFPLQLGISMYSKGHSIKPHEHRSRKIEITKVQEIIHVDRGRANVHLYDHTGKRLQTIEVVTGDTVFLIDGGHGFEILEDTKFIEVKQGPYLDKQTDKQMINGTNADSNSSTHYRLS